MSKLRKLVLVIAVLAISVSYSYAVESDTPCTDAWANCTDSPAVCNAFWCGCMYGKYGYTGGPFCSAATIATDTKRVSESSRRLREKTLHQEQRNEAVHPRNGSRPNM
jgi:hypothetical protein